MSSNRRFGNDHSISKKADGNVPVILPVASTIGGIGVPSGTSKSPWGSTFRDRQKFFENAEKKEDDCSGDQDDTPRLSRSSSQRRRSVRSTSSSSSQSSPRRVVSPHVVYSPTITTTTSSVSQGNAGVLSHETGQKESVSDNFTQVQPDPVRTSTVNQELITSRDRKKDDLESDKERRSMPVLESSRCEMQVPDTTPPKVKTRVLDGSGVHKDNESIDLSEVPPIGGLRRPVQSKAAPSHNDADKDLLDRITLLMSEKNRLDARLAEVTEENRSYQSKVTVQQKTISNLQGLSSEVKKQKESLQSENVKLSKTLASAEKQRDSLLLLEQELRGNVEILEKKIAKVEGFYQTSEERKQSLKKELELLKKDQDKLRDENTELGQELMEEQVAKQNYLETIKKSQDRVNVLESDLQVLSKEKESIMKERDRQQRLASEAQRKSSEKEKKVNKIEKELNELKNVNEKLQKENGSLSQKLDQSLSSSQQLKQQIEEVKWEKQQVEQRMAVVRQNEGDLRAILDQVVSEVDDFSRELKETVPDIVVEVPPTKRVVRPLSASPDASAHLKKMKSINSVVLSGLSTLSNRRKALDQKVSKLESQIKMKCSCIEQLERKLRDSRKECEVVRKEVEERTKELVDSHESRLQESELEIAKLKEGCSLLKTENLKLQSDLDSIKQQSDQQLEGLQSALDAKQAQLQDYEKQVGQLLAEKTIVVAQLQLASEADKATEKEKLSYQQLQIEKQKLEDELTQLQKDHYTSLATLKNQQEEMEDFKLETEKIKMHLTTEMSLLKAQISQLEKEKNDLKSKSSLSSGSAFQPIQPTVGQVSRKVMFDPAQEKSQKEVLDLKHKLTLMEAENKRLLDLTQTSSTMMDAGNALRKHTLEMRKRCIFLESEKKQLTDKVHTLHTSLKALRESKDRMISERLRALQNENISLQDSIRTSETMFNKKLMNAASRIAETLKDNDKLRCTLGHLENGLSSIDTLLTGLNQLSADIQRQEQELATLRATLAGSGSNLIPAMEISKRILNTHGEIQSLLASRMPEEMGRAMTLGRSASSSSGALPPVLQQFPSAYISTIDNNSEKLPPPGRTRSHSQSQSMSSSVPTYILQLREKMSQLHADNMSICDLVKHSQDSLEARHNDVSRLRDELLSLLSNIQVSVKVMHESRDQLLALNQQTLPIEQLTSIEFLEREVENWQDKVFACEMALKDIETRMQEDYESHNQRFSQLMSQILDLKEENSGKRDKLLANEQYIHDIEERCLNAENELFKLRKEMECVMQEALKVGGQQLSNHGGHVSELIRSQNEDLMNLRVLLNSSAYHQSRLQSKLESIHRENTILKHQGLETDRHHTKILEELYMERDYLRKMNSQLIERQLKTDEAGDMLKKIKRSQEAEKELRDFKKLSTELNNMKFAIREKDIAIGALQHQLESQQLELLKLQTLSAADTMIGSAHQPKLIHQHPPGRSMRPLSANSVDLARQSRYLITNLDHPKVVNRNPMESTGAGDFLIPIPASNTGDSILNLNESGPKATDGRYILGFPVVTDDEGANFTNETNITSSKQTKGRNRRHRRTASEGSDSLKSLMSSGSSASDSKPTRPFNHSSTLPRQQVQQQKDLKRPESVDSMCFEGYSPINTPTPAENTQVKEDVVGHFAQKFSEQIDVMIHQHDEVDDTKPTKLETTSNPVKVERSSAEKGGKGERFSARIKNIRHVFGSKGNVLEKDKGSSSKSSDTNSSDEVTRASKSTPQLLTGATADLSKSDEASSSTSSSNQVSRMTSFASTVDRSNSFASTVSTTYSELGGESSPYSNLSLDSFSITDSVDNLMTLDKTFHHRGPFFTPISHQNYTSSSDDESRYANGGNRTLKRTSASYYKDFPMPLFLPLRGHHRTTSSCDSDQLLADAVRSDGSGGKIPVHRDESISISDMDKELTDQEDIQGRIHRLEKKFGKVRRSSTGSITICNHSGSSMEDIKNAGD